MWYKELIIYLVIGSMLLFSSFWDIKYKALRLWWLVLSVIISIATYIFIYGFNLFELILSIMPSLFIMMFAYAGKRTIGMADAIISADLGIILGLYNCISILILAMVLSVFYGGIMWIRAKNSLNTEYPFIPFLTGAFFINQILLQGI